MVSDPNSTATVQVTLTREQIDILLESPQAITRQETGIPEWTAHPHYEGNSALLSFHAAILAARFPA